MNCQNELLIYWYSSQVNQRCSDIKGSTKLYLCTISSVCTLHGGCGWDDRACFRACHLDQKIYIWYFVFVKRLQTLPTLPTILVTFFMQWLQQSHLMYIKQQRMQLIVLFLHELIECNMFYRCGERSKNETYLA